MEPRIRPATALAAIMLALLVAGPFMFYPATALSNVSPESNELDVTLSMEIAERVARNLSETHSYIKTMATLAETLKALEEKQAQGLEAQQELEATSEAGKTVIPALKALSENGVLDYAYRYIDLRSIFNFSSFSMFYYLRWSDTGSAVKYRPSDPANGVFGGMTKHKVAFHHSHQPAERRHRPWSGRSADSRAAIHQACEVRCLPTELYHAGRCVLC